MKHLPLKILMISLTLVMGSCSGYKLIDNRNPLRNYGISSVSVPLFINQSIIPNVNSYLTKAFAKKLSEYSGLKVYTTEKKGADAILLGIVSSSLHRKEVFNEVDRRFIPESGALKDSIGERPRFYVHYQGNYSLTVRLILIKDPATLSERFFEKTPGVVVKAHPNVIFDEILNMNQTYANLLFDNVSPDSGGVVNFTNSKRNMDNNLRSASEGLALSFQRVLLNAF